MNPDQVDRILLQLMQDEFPLEGDPWGALARRLSVSSDEILFRVRRLQDSGILRRICPILESGKAGIGASTLVALQVPPDRVERVALIINGFPEVSHNYLRDHRYNIWFTLGSRDRKELEQTIQEIRDRCGTDCRSMIELPVKRRFKIDVRFPVSRKEEPA
jgi:DNA-binding Lrp family transcriptional regulator